MWFPRGADRPLGAWHRTLGARLDSVWDNRGVPLWRLFGRVGKVYVTASAVIAAAALAAAALSENYVLWVAMIVVTLPSSVPAYVWAVGVVFFVSFDVLGLGLDESGLVSWLVTGPILFGSIVLAAICNVLLVQTVASVLRASRSRSLARPEH